jgi:hypothetical protein
MLTIDISLLIAVLLIGFAGGYAVRELKSRQRRRRWRENYCYGPRPTSASTALEGQVVARQRSLAPHPQQGKMPSFMASNIAANR